MPLPCESGCQNPLSGAKGKKSQRNLKVGNPTNSSFSMSITLTINGVGKLTVNNYDLELHNEGTLLVYGEQRFEIGGRAKRFVI